MRYKIAVLVSLLGLALGGAQGCGKLGNKSDADGTLNYQTANAGCLDTVGDQVSRYGSGQISSDELTSAWNCVSGSLTLFSQFIRGSVADGYTPQDIQVFISHFLLTRQPINLALVQNAFALKASIFGGTANVITFDEINKLLSFVNVLQTESLRILPHLVERANNPTPENLISLSDAIRTAGSNLAGALQTTNNPSLTSAQIQSLMQEVEAVTTPTASEVIGPYGQLVTAVKQLLAQGSSNEIEGAAWPVLIKSIGEYFGPVLAIASYATPLTQQVNPQGRLLTQCMLRLVDALNYTIKRNGGSIPFSLLTNVLQRVPAKILSSAKAAAFVSSENMIFTKILQSQTPNAIDQRMTQYIMKQVNFWDETQTVLQTLYDDNGIDEVIGATGAQIMDALATYASGDHANADVVSWITQLVQNYMPYFNGNDNEVTFDGASLYSLHDMGMKHMIRLGTNAILSGYNTGPNAGQIDYTDFAQFITDLTPILNAFQMSDPSLPSGTQARWLEADLFMPSSGGQNYLDLNEGSQYILYFLSIYNQANRVTPVVNAACKSYGTDAYGAQLMNADCFRKAYFANYQTLWDRMPLLTKFYSGLSSADQEKMQVALETSARYYGYSNQCVGLYDIESMQGILHFMETILERFDSKGEGFLNTQDALNVFPLFQNELVTVGSTMGLSATDTGEQQAALTYLLAHGSLPSGLWGDVEFVWWWLAEGQSCWNLQASRISLYQAMASISPPMTPPATSPCQ